MRRLLTVVAVCMVWAGPVWAQCVGPAQADVQTAVNAAATGSTVLVCAGEATWTSSTVAAVVINKAITLQGAGCAVDTNGRATDPCGTIITDNSAQQWEEVAIFVNYSESSLVRITGLKIVRGSTAGNYSASVRITGGASSFRIDHCVFDGNTRTQANGIDIRGNTYGLIDRNTFQSSQGNMWKAIQAVVYHVGDIWVTQSPAPISLGTANAIYIEDNTFTEAQTDATPYGLVDAAAGVRIVFRYNITNNAGHVGGHGWDTDMAAPVSIEVYNNTFNWTISGNQWTVASIRGGTGVYFNNTLTATAGGWDSFIKLYYYCACAAMVGPGLNCNTSSPYNHSLQTYPGHQQPGFGPNGSGGQVSAPIYEWNNTTTVSPHMGAAGSCANEATLIQANRDYFLNTAMPGYTAYTYPHPLTGAPTAPTGVRIR